MKGLIVFAITMLAILSLGGAAAHAQTAIPNKDSWSHSRVADPEFQRAFRQQTRRPMRFGFSLMPAGSGAASSAISVSPLAAGPNLQVLGSGTLGRLTRWTGFTSSNSFIGDSTIFEDKNGFVGIGTDLPTSRLTVAGTIQSLSGGFQFPDGTVQTTSATGSLFSVTHDATLMGAGTAGSPLGIAVPLVLSGSVENGFIVEVNNSSRFGLGMRVNAGPEGVALFSVAGDTDEGTGGDGVRGFGGTSRNGSGGDGFTGTGGDSFGAGNSAGSGIQASGGEGFDGAANGLAGNFMGDVDVSDDLNVTGTKNFKIDHPLDPENKYLYHAAIESAEVLNVYSGNVTTNHNGEAVVTLPDWFEALNSDLRYQLTVIGTFAQAIVARKVRNNRFIVRTNVPNIEVSWQVTGVRSDASMKKRAFRAEQEKPMRERGTYLHPEAYGQPEGRGVEWARNPDLMQQLKQRRIESKQKRSN